MKDMRFVVLFFTWSFSFVVCAQEEEGVMQKKFTQALSNRLAKARVFHFEYMNLSQRSFDMKTLGSTLGEAKIRNQYGFSANINLPVLVKKKYRVTYSLETVYQNFNVDPQAIEPNISEVSMETRYLVSSLSYTHFSRMFEKPAIFSGTVMVDGSFRGLERMKGLVTGSIVVSASATKSFTLGLAVVLDQTAALPVFPLVTYTKAFVGENWRIDALLPSKVVVQRRLGEKSRLSIGSELDVDNFYLRDIGLEGSPDVFEFRETRLKSGLWYEHLIGNRFVFTSKMGVISTVQAMLVEKGERFNQDNAVMEFEPKPSFYFNLGVSFNPFGFKK